LEKVILVHVIVFHLYRDVDMLRINLEHNFFPLANIIMVFDQKSLNLYCCASY
jgi:hypothetical protein